MLKSPRLPRQRPLKPAQAHCGVQARAWVRAESPQATPASSFLPWRSAFCWTASLPFVAFLVGLTVGTFFSSVAMDSFSRPGDAAIAKPYIKLGIKEWFDFENRVVIPAQTTLDGTLIASPRRVANFTEDETFWNVEGGYLLEMQRTTFQGSVFYDGSGDAETIGGRLGLVFKTN
jgi:hypothetical protein